MTSNELAGSRARKAPALDGRAAGNANGSFRLIRFYAAATLLVFAAVLATIVYLERQEVVFFERVQQAQAKFFAKAQSDLAQQNEQAARTSLLAVHEAGHVNLTRLVANTMWQTDFAPLVAAAQRVPVERCRAIQPAEPGGPAAAARRQCYAEVGRLIRALPGFRELDAKAYAAMRASTVFKIKVFDLRGITVYSSEHAQIGEDASSNMGWKTAVKGRAASELTHRDRFSTFEGVVENRDLISSYVPVRAGPKDPVVGVFELYSDVTPFLDSLRTASRSFADNIAANDANVARTSMANQTTVDESSTQFLFVVGGLVCLLYAASLVIVWIGQREIDRKTRAQEEALARERLWHREKMAALSTMAANVSHEVGNPLTVIAWVAEMLPDRDGQTPGESIDELSRRILEQTTRIAQMMRKISKFTEARSSIEEFVEVNPMIDAVCEFQRFDHRYRRVSIRFEPGEQLPARKLVPDYLNEVMMNLLQACADLSGPAGTEHDIRVATSARGDDVWIETTCPDHASGAPISMHGVLGDRRFDIVRQRVADLGGRLDITNTGIGIALPGESEQTV